MQALVTVQVLVDAPAADEDDLAQEVQQQLDMGLYDFHVCGAKVVGVREFDFDWEFAQACAHRDPWLEEEERRWLNE